MQNIVIDNLTSTSIDKALSANMGRMLNSKIPDIVDNLTSTSTTSTLSANQGRILKSNMDGLHIYIPSKFSNESRTNLSNVNITWTDITISTSGFYYMFMYNDASSGTMTLGLRLKSNNASIIQYRYWSGAPSYCHLVSEVVWIEAGSYQYVANSTSSRALIRRY